MLLYLVMFLPCFTRDFTMVYDVFLMKPSVCFFLYYMFTVSYHIYIYIYIIIIYDIYIVYIYITICNIHDGFVDILIFVRSFSCKDDLLNRLEEKEARIRRRWVHRWFTRW